MAKAKLHAATGAYKAEFDLPASHFEQPVSEAAMYNAVDVYMGNQRQGTHKTKNRSEVSGGGKKPWKQKGTGRARQGSNTAPQWVRGGKAHGPLPHLYKRDINKKVKRRALLSALTMKANESSVYVFEAITLTAPKTKELAKVLATAALAGQRNLILVSEADKNLALAARNIPDVMVQRVWDVNTYWLISAKNIIFTDGAMKALTAPPATGGAAEKVAKPKAASAKGGAKPKAAKAEKA
ncbi:MAG: 50S ribosomal protein L4 [Fibrobacterota bacterium]|nr:50S ribosomal protein L4 [Fibrobacterota bacterium]